jgi:hypothetical protein
MFGKTYGAKFLFIIRRTAIEDAVPVEFGGVVPLAHKDLFDRACLRAAREAMREWRFERDCNGLRERDDPIGADMTRRRLLDAAIESRNAYCHANLQKKDADFDRA